MKKKMMTLIISVALTGLLTACGFNSVIWTDYDIYYGFICFVMVHTT